MKPDHSITASCDRNRNSEPPGFDFSFALQSIVNSRSREIVSYEARPGFECLPEVDNALFHA